MKTRMAQFAMAIWIFLAGCSRPDFATIDVEPFRERWNASAQNSTVSWWYAGEDDEHYYLVEAWPTERHAYMVSKENAELRGVERRPVSRNQDEWSNLKREHVLFR
jgi:hypothetical protein